MHDLVVLNYKTYALVHPLKTWGMSLSYRKLKADTDEMAYSYHNQVCMGKYEHRSIYTITSS